MIRRGFLGGMIAMTIPGAGGQQQRPFTAAGQQTPTGVQAGVSAGIDYARVVVVFGPSGAVNGIFIYEAGTTPAKGNGPLLSGTEATQDPYGNTVVPGWTAYGGGGYASLAEGILSLVAAAGQHTAGQVTVAGEGGVDIESGTVSGSDSQAAIQLFSEQAPAGPGTVRINLVASQVQLDSSASATIPLAALSQFPISGSATLATTITAVNALYAALVTAGVFA